MHKKSYCSNAAPDARRALLHYGVPTQMEKGVLFKISDSELKNFETSEIPEFPLKFPKKLVV